MPANAVPYEGLNLYYVRLFGNIAFILSIGFSAPVVSLIFDFVNNRFILCNVPQKHRCTMFAIAEIVPSSRTIPLNFLAV